MKTEVKQRTTTPNDFPTPNHQNQQKQRINCFTCFKLKEKQLQIGNCYSIIGRITKITQESQRQYTFLICDDTDCIKVTYTIFGHVRPEWIDKLVEEIYYQFFITPKRHIGSEDFELVLEIARQITDFNFLSFNVANLIFNALQRG